MQMASTADVAVSRPRVLVVVEGVHDVEFLKRASRILSGSNSALPNLAALESDSKLVFVPIGGSHSGAWTSRLRPLGVPEFHLYDRDLPPYSRQRLAIADDVNQRPRCQAVVTRRRQLESYLHPRSLLLARGLDVTYGEDDDVSEIAARAVHAKLGSKPWHRLPADRRRKLKRRAKGWLNTEAADRMTPELFAEHDSAGDVASWLRAIAQLAL